MKEEDNTEKLNKDRLSSSDSLAARELLHELQEEQEELKAQKRKIEVQKTKIKNLVRTSGYMERDKYRACCDSQAKYAQQIQVIEQRLGQNKMEIRKLNDQLHGAPHQKRLEPTQPQESPKASNPAIKKECLEAMVALRSKYQEFAADHTRVSSMRKMAAEFVLELNPVIKAAMRG